MVPDEIGSILRPLRWPRCHERNLNTRRLGRGQRRPRPPEEESTAAQQGAVEVRGHQSDKTRSRHYSRPSTTWNRTLRPATSASMRLTVASAPAEHSPTTRARINGSLIYTRAPFGMTSTIRSTKCLTHALTHGWHRRMLARRV